MPSSSKTKEQSHPVDGWLKDLAEKLAVVSSWRGSERWPSPSSSTSFQAQRAQSRLCGASEVWDQIDECLKRCVTHTNDDAELINNIRRIEYQLSAALTKLKNSMMRNRCRHEL